MLAVLPPELALQILSYSSYSTLASLLCTSKAWNTLISEHEATIYRHTAYRYDLIDSPKTSFEDITIHLRRSPWEREPVRSWKELCHRSWSLEKNWQAKKGSHSIARVLQSAGDVVHRIKVDEKAGICIVSHKLGGLTVSDLGSPRDDSKMLWGLLPHYVRHHAHVEYENGYLVFDRLTGAKEVWRLASTLPADGPREALWSQPDESMRVMNAYAASRYYKSADRHGHFVPWALLRAPEPTWAYHVAYPMLATVGSGDVYMFDLPTGARHHIPTESGEEACYVELNHAYVFICSQESVSVYSRQGGAHVLEIPTSTKAARLANVHPLRSPPDTVPVGKVLERPEVTDWNPASVVGTASGELAVDRLTAVATHITPDGRHLAIMCDFERLILIQDWERIVRGEATLESCTMVVRVQGGRLSYLAVADNRFAVAATTGIYIFTLDAARHGHDSPQVFHGYLTSPPSSSSESSTSSSSNSTYKQPPFPHLTVSAARPWLDDGSADVFDADGDPVPGVSCLQLTDRAVYFTWDVAGRAMPRFGVPPPVPVPSASGGGGSGGGGQRRNGLGGGGGGGTGNWVVYGIGADDDDDDEVPGEGEGEGEEMGGEMDDVEWVSDGEDDDGHPMMMALIPWGPHAEVGCIDMTVLA